MSNPILEGVFAIHKPTAVSSAQVLRDLQSHLNPSKTFAPWINAERARRDAELQYSRGKRSRKSRQPVQVKVGHGGTLDPMATGVLIIGLGNGTKSLQAFLDGTKSYEAVMVFGAATDTYDSEGKIVKRAPYEHVTRTAVEAALAKFRGPILQKPPIFSALRVQGKRLYEYAREGIEVPVEIKDRPVTVSELEITEWMEPGTHIYQFPLREAGQEEKEVVDKLLPLVGGADKGSPVVQKETDQAEKSQMDAQKDSGEPTAEQDAKRKREDDGEDTDQAEASISKKVKQEPHHSLETPPGDQLSADQPPERHPNPAPAVRIRMTVSSGFYVRSLCHDLGAAVNSLGFMAELARTRASEFELGKNTLPYEELAKGEDVWGPQIKDLLMQWNETHPNGLDRQSQPAKRQHGSAPRNSSSNPASSSWPKSQNQRPRNSSSPEA